MRGGGQPGYVGLARSTRQALGLPEFLPAPRTDVAREACRLVAGDGQVVGADERLVDFVVGVVEAVDDIVASVGSVAELPPDMVERAEAEAASWLGDFLADGGGPPDRELVVALSGPGADGAADGAEVGALLLALARRMADALCRAMATRMAAGRPAP
jgi:hypothetical protein